MPRLPDAEIERIKYEIEIVALIRGSGVELKPQGNDFVGRCPFHDDKTPSLVVSPGKRLWNCLGACQSGGTVIDWVMKSQRVSFRHAVEILRASHGDVPGGQLPAMPIRAGNAPSTVRSALLPIDFTASDSELLNTVQEHYAGSLSNNPQGTLYLQRRKIYSPELVEHFGIGFSDRSLGLKLPQANRVKGEALRARLTELGIFRRSGHEHLVGCLTFPIFDAERQVLSFYGRRIEENPARHAPKHLYLSGPHRGVFNLAGFSEAQKNSGTLVLCEAIIDALTLWNAGFKNVSATYGAGGWTEAYKAAIAAYNIQRVLVAFDGDEAGGKGCEQVLEALAGLPVEVLRVPVPWDTDINELAQGIESPDEIQRCFSDLLAAAVPVRGLPAQTASILTKAAVVVEGSTPAAPVAPAPAASVVDVLPMAAPVALNGYTVECREAGQYVYGFDDVTYRVQVQEGKPAAGSLRCAVLVRRADAVYADTLELWQEKARRGLAEQAAAELMLRPEDLRKQLGQILLHLDGTSVQPKNQSEVLPLMTERERAEALEYLTREGLMDRLRRDLSALGLVGELANQLGAYLAATSRKLDGPLAVVIQSSSAAGKSSLMDSVLALMPGEDVVKYSAMTGQSLYYMGDKGLKHKILAVAEEAGAERASYALKLLQSEGELTIASAGKDEKTGKLITQEYRVEGPVAIFLTTTSTDVDEELLNRCLVLSVSESREQTRAIHTAQRKAQTLEGMLDKERRVAIATLHRNVQRLLKPVRVVNPLALNLSFGDERTRSRRDNLKYLTLIRAITFLHQYQRPRQSAHAVEYIESTPEDVALATELLPVVLGRSSEDLPPQTQRLLGLMDVFVSRGTAPRSEVWFTRKELRSFCHWGDTQLKVHLSRLVDLEILLIRRLKWGLMAYSLALDSGEVKVLCSGTMTDPGRGPGHPGRGANDSGRGPVGLRSVAGEVPANADETVPIGTSGRSVGALASSRIGDAAQLVS